MATIVVWMVLGVLLALWSVGLWGVHALLNDPPATVLALQQMLHGLPTLEGWGDWARQARDGLVNLLDDALLLASVGLGAAREWRLLQWLDEWLAPLLWTLWSLGALTLAAIGAAWQAVIRGSRPPTAVA